METFSERWLILEQESDRGEWLHDLNPYSHLIWNVEDFALRNGVPNPTQKEQEICILFLPVRHGNWTLPLSFSNRGRWLWNVWCHYGRDISLAELKQRWRIYGRLTDAEKARLSRDSVCPPLPFSRSMPLPWSKDFRQLKDKVRQQSMSSADGNDAASFHRCLNLLSHARALATGNQCTQESLEQAREALPVVLAARHLLSALPKWSEADVMPWPEMLRYSLDLCQHSGLMAMAHRKEQFSGRVREAYRNLGWIVVRLNLLQQQPDQRIHTTAADLESLRMALRFLLWVADEEASTTSQALMKDS